MRVDFLHLDGIKEFERATMTRIGRCQIKTHNLLAMLPPGETISPRSKFPDHTASISISAPTSLGCTLTTPGAQAFLNRIVASDGSREAYRLTK
jgi:hypothetical protein